MLRAVAVMAFILALGSARASAQETTEDRAKSFYKQGLEHYQKKHYREAIEAFKKSYALSEKPRLLFNIAQAHRLAGDCQEALDYYREFLSAEPKTSVAPEVKQRIGEMEECLKPKPKPAAETAPVPASDPDATSVAEAAPTPDATPAPDDPGSSKRIAGLVTGGVGVVLAGTAVYFGLQASKAADKVNQRFADGGEWTQEYRDIEAQGKSDQTLAIILGASGAAAIATGAVLYVLGARDDDVGIAFLPGGAVVTWAGSF